MTLTACDQKRFATLQARAALHGVSLHCSDGDNGQPVYVATRWAMTRQLNDIAQAEIWLDMVTGGAMEGAVA